MIVLPEIVLSSRFRDRADRASIAFLRRVQDMPSQDLRSHLLHGQTEIVGAVTQIRYAPTGSFRSGSIGFAPSSTSAWDAEVTAISTLQDPAFEIRRLRPEICLRHSETLLRRRVGNRPFLTETEERLAIACRDGIHTFVLQSACGREGDEVLIRYELSARLARAEIKTRAGESRHAGWRALPRCGRGTIQHTGERLRPTSIRPIGRGATGPTGRLLSWSDRPDLQHEEDALVVARQDAVSGRQLDPLDTGLRDEKPVERVLVTVGSGRGQGAHGCGMACGDGQLAIAGMGQALRQRDGIDPEVGTPPSSSLRGRYADLREIAPMAIPPMPEGGDSG